MVAASIIIATLGSPGCTYDWSWMMPFGPWLARLDYANKPIEPSVQLLSALNAYVVALVEPLPDGLAREVLLRDAGRDRSRPRAPRPTLIVHDGAQSRRFVA